MELEISMEVLGTGELKVLRVPITERMVLGRGPESPIALEGPQISREHIVLAATGTQLSLWNMNPTATLVNGAPVAAGMWIPLQPADRVQLPGYNLSFLLLGVAVATPKWWQTITGGEKTAAVVLAMAVTVAVVFWRL